MQKKKPEQSLHSHIMVINNVPLIINKEEINEQNPLKIPEMNFNLSRFKHKECCMKTKSYN